MRSLGATVTAMILLAGCGGGARSGGAYAGLTEYEAGAAAQRAMSQELGDPSSPVFQKGLLVDEVVEGRRPNGRPAWIATFTDFDNRPSGVCIWVWAGTFAPFSANYRYAVGDCPPPDA